MSTKTNVPSWKMDNLFEETISLLISFLPQGVRKNNIQTQQSSWFMIFCDDKKLALWHVEQYFYYDEFLPRQPRFSSGFVWIILQEFLVLVEWSIKFVVDSLSFLKRKNAREEGWLVTQRYLSAAPFCRVTAINNDAAIPSKSLNAPTVLPSSLERAKRTWFYCFAFLPIGHTNEWLIGRCGILYFWAHRDGQV